MPHSLRPLPRNTPEQQQYITLTCSYDENLQETLTAALRILGTTLPADVLQKRFQYNLTTSGKTLAAILKENNANKHFQFEDYNAAVIDKNLIPVLRRYSKATRDQTSEVPSGSTTVSQSFANSTAKQPNQETNVELISGRCFSLT
jgi:hypothetical protein